MSTVVDRTCTEMHDIESGIAKAHLFGNDNKPLSDFGSADAYVLLGDPGAGKTTEFDRESAALGDAALKLSARDFVILDLDSHPEWRDRILFIDGLDEMRAGQSDSRVPLDVIRNRLDQLRPPQFRISCRDADWLGHSDRHSLKTVAPDASVTVLRLDPLSEPSAIKLLESTHSVPDGRAFLAEAHQLGLSAMLGNPLKLALLADAVVKGGAWPETRLEAFAAACREMAAESNPEHLAGTGERPRSTVLDAAGYLSALLLLLGEAGYSLPSSAAAPASVAVAELGEAPGGLSQDDLSGALGTKLFTAVAEGVFAPMHRQVAEFLAGRYLAKLISEGLPARRVTALMVGPSDERVVTSLRGLSAWLAAHSLEARPSLIDADPVGVGLYGDIGGLSTGEKMRLVESLSTFAAEASLLGHQRRDGRSYGYLDDTAWTFRSLATADMAPTMKTLLSRPGPGAAEDRLELLILGALSHADDPSSVAGLQGDLAAILFDDARTPAIREQALEAYLHVVPPCDARTQLLRQLLDAVQGGSVPDPDDGLRGALLEILYPGAIAPSEVWRYTLPRNPDYMGRFWSFWRQILPDKSSGQQLAELLDSLHVHASDILPSLARSHLDDLPAELLKRCLDDVGGDYEPSRLYGWLVTAASSLKYLHHNDEPARGIRAWLEAHPEVQNEIVLTWLRQRDPGESDGLRGHWSCEALHGSTPPPNFGPWCLDRAIQTGDTEPRVSRGLLVQAYNSLYDPSSSGLTLETMRERTRDQPALSEYLDELCPPHSSGESSAEDDHRRRRKELLRQRDEKRSQQRLEWATHLDEHLTDLRANSFPSQNLSTLACVYLGVGVDVYGDESPTERLIDFIGDDTRRVEAVLAALRDAVSRQDIADVHQTISLSLESRHSWMAYPVLASLEMLDSEDPARLDALSDEQKHRGLATYYCVPCRTKTPRWHDRWLQRDPELVLDVLLRCAVAGVRTGREVPSGLNELDNVQGHRDQVHEVRLRLLEAFPTRSSNKHLPLLDRLLSRALDHPDTAALLDLAQRKQRSKSMPVGQQIRWWTTDALIVQGARLQELKPHLVGGEVRVRHLAQFLRSIWDRHDREGLSELAVDEHGEFYSRPAGDRRSSILDTIQDLSTLRGLIEILGSWCGAPKLASGVYTLEIRTSEFVMGLIGRLGADPREDAGQLLAELAKDPRLEDWYPQLIWALEEHRVIRRDASYRHPSIEQIQETLRGGSPANAADLAALLVDRLDDIRDDLRGGSSDPWQLFWNEGEHRRLIGPKSEDSCRNALLGQLTGQLRRSRLPDGVEAVREGSYASDTRSDIRVSCRGFNVPIEIKKDSHRNVWKAMRDQLMASYTRDPATAGHGIYLVLWFKETDKPATRHPGSGMRPSTPEELKEWLEQSLTQEEARKISVIVLDVTKPGSEAEGTDRRLAPVGSSL